MTQSTTSTWALHTQQSLDEVNVHLAALQDAGLLGVAEQDGRATLYLPRRAPLPVEGEWEELEPQDWNVAWKAALEPVTVGEVTIVAPWHDREANENTVVLVIEPAQAFGTGHHETTTACLEALQSLPLAGRSVFDVGTGTGVLALTARALGAQRVLAVDIDPIAVQTARRNAQINDLTISVEDGSTECAHGEQFDLVIANLDTDTLSGLAAELAGSLRPGGTFVGSGISNERVGEAVRALAGVGLHVSADQGREWALLQGEAATPRTC